MTVRPGRSSPGATPASEPPSATWRRRPVAVPILDVGVGGGRTTTMLRLLSDDYIGVDYTSEMVAVSRRNYPGADIRWGDVGKSRTSPTGISNWWSSATTGSTPSITTTGPRPSPRSAGSSLPEDAPWCRRTTRPARASGPARGASPLAVPRHLDVFRPAPAVPGPRGRHPGALPPGAGQSPTADEVGRRGSGVAVRPVEAHDFGLLIHYVTLEEAAASSRGRSHTRACLRWEQGATVSVGDDTRHPVLPPGGPQALSAGCGRWVTSVALVQ